MVEEFNEAVDDIHAEVEQELVDEREGEQAPEDAADRGGAREAGIAP